MKQVPLGAPEGFPEDLLEVRASLLETAAQQRGANDEYVDALIRTANDPDELRETIELAEVREDLLDLAEEYAGQGKDDLAETYRAWANDPARLEQQLDMRRRREAGLPLITRESAIDKYLGEYSDRLSADLGYEVRVTRTDLVIGGVSMSGIFHPKEQAPRQADAR